MNKLTIRVCSGTVKEPCQKVLDNRGIDSIETKEEAEALAIFDIIRCTHGLCQNCYKKTINQINQLTKLS